MKYLYKKGDITFVECTECKRVMKFKEYQLQEVKDGIECFCGKISNSIKGIPVVKKQTTPTNNVQHRTIEQKPIEPTRVSNVPI